VCVWEGAVDRCAGTLLFFAVVLQTAETLNANNTKLMFSFAQNIRGAPPRNAAPLSTPACLVSPPRCSSIYLLLGEPSSGTPTHKPPPTATSTPTPHRPGHLETGGGAARRPGQSERGARGRAAAPEAAAPEWGGGGWRCSAGSRLGVLHKIACKSLSFGCCARGLIGAWLRSWVLGTGFGLGGWAVGAGQHLARVVGDYSFKKALTGRGH